MIIEALRKNFNNFVLILITSRFGIKPVGSMGFYSSIVTKSQTLEAQH